MTPHKISYWITPFARHEIPDAIIKLAEKAEYRVTGRRGWIFSEPQCFAYLMGVQETVYFKVIEEWGKWREQKDYDEYESRRNHK